MEQSTETANRQLVKRLLENEQAAWLDIMTRAMVILKGTEKYRQIARKRGIELEEITIQLFINLHANQFQPLKEFKFKCKFDTFLWWQLRTSFRTLVREVGDMVSLQEPDSLNDSYQDCAFCAGTDNSDEEPLPHTSQSPVAQPSADSLPMVHEEKLQAIQGAFTKLWRQSPKQAFIFLLRGDLEMPSTEVADFLNLKINTIDQSFHRAKVAMQKLYRSE